MATAAARIESGVEIPGEDADTEAQTGARDLEAEARELGWVPEDEFKGDKARWVDAETFVKKGEEVMPLIKAQNARLKRELDSIKKDLRRATAHFEGAEKRAYERALVDVEKRHSEAVEAGDVKAATAAAKEMRDLKPDGEPQKHTKEEAEDALDAFREENPWYDRANLANATEIDINARLYFDRMVDRNIERTKELSPPDFFQLITDMTVEKYPQLKAKPARQKPASAVEGGTAGRGGRGASKTWDNLPDAAKKQYGRFIERGIGIKSTGDKEKDLAAARAYYAKTHDWEGYAE